MKIFEKSVFRTPGTVGKIRNGEKTGKKKESADRKKAGEERANVLGKGTGEKEGRDEDRRKRNGKEWNGGGREDREKAGPKGKAKSREEGGKRGAARERAIKENEGRESERRSKARERTRPEKEIREGKGWESRRKTVQRRQKYPAEIRPGKR